MKSSKKQEPKSTQETILLPVLPLKDVVVFPYLVIPLFVGRYKSLQALNQAEQQDTQILLLTQKEDREHPSADQLYATGTIATVLQSLQLADQTRKVLVEGVQRAKVQSFQITDDCLLAEVALIECKPLEGAVNKKLALIKKQFEQYVKHNHKIPTEILASLEEIEEPGKLLDTIAAHLVSQSVDDRQEILEYEDENQRFKHITAIIESDTEMLRIEKKIRSRVKSQMEKSQKEYYLNEQMKAIQRELGDSEDGVSEIDEITQKVEESGMSAEAREKVDVEVKRLKMMSPMSAEATVVRNFIDWLIAVPWKKRTRINKNLNAAEKILDDDHYGLEKVKERILEYLAVQQRVRKIKGPILCLVGPPGVGKTSLGKSVARATNRKFMRMSLGGVRDEAEIRGHRRTYIGSLPGKIIQNMAKVKVKNPLFMLDEVDKMSMDFRGDPSSALLEVLDPEQNHTFVDHYLEVDYDLSEVMFIATANTLNIPPPLLDRMEVIRISGYTEEEKVKIAEQYLLPKQLKNNGLKEHEVAISRPALVDIVRYYTREAGVRGMEREIAKIMRKIARKFVQSEGRIKKISIRPKSLEGYLGVRQYRYGRTDAVNQVGQVTGLAWTQTGGELLRIEAIVVPGKGRHIYTGKLGDVMQESIQAAVSVVRSRAAGYGIPTNFYQRKDIHVHVPEGSTPKDGPSAGVAMSVAIFSALTKIPIRADVAMTGEITLRGEVLPVGGLKEKLLAAHRGGVERVLIPDETKKDLAEIPAKVKENLEIVPVRWIDEVLELSLESMPEIRPSSDDLDVEMDLDDSSEDSAEVVKH